MHMLHLALLPPALWTNPALPTGNGLYNQEDLIFIPLIIHKRQTTKTSINSVLFIK